MTRAVAARGGILLVLAVALVFGVLGVQLAHGGGDYTPTKPKPPCAARHVTSVAKGIDALTERLVLIGLDRAACRLGVTREALTLQLAESHVHTDAQIVALHAGLLDAVARMKAEHSIPPAADLTDEALKNADLPGFVKYLIRHLPDSVINKALKTDDVLRRTVNNLDLRKVLANLSDAKDLNQQINAAVTKAVKDSLLNRLKHLV